MSITTGIIANEVLVQQGASLICTGMLNLPMSTGNDLIIEGGLQLSDSEIKGTGSILIKGEPDWTKGILSVASVTEVISNFP